MRFRRLRYSRSDFWEALPPQGIEFWSTNLADDSLRNRIERSVNAEIRRREFVARGLDADLVSQVQKTRIPMIALNPKKEAVKRI